MSAKLHTNAVSGSGAALVEFVLVLPLLLVLLLGIIDFGRALNYWIDTTHLANVTARWAAVGKNPGPDGTLQASIQGQADTAELRDGGTTQVPNPVQICISFPDGSSEVGDRVTATASVDYQWLPFLDLPSASTTLTGEATMRLEAGPDDQDYSEGC
jgi:Flp pilus assembly protein TadG